MDELTSSLSLSWKVSTVPNDPSAPHPRFAQYKAKTSCNQDERRRRRLEAQKQRRFDFLQHARRLADEDFELDDTGQDEAEEMDVSTEVIKRPPRTYKNQLMLSEWLVEVPATLEEDWLITFCPVGKRCLVVASHGTTRSYARNGFRISSFPSLLPGGCKSLGNAVSFTLLDCIWSEVNRTFYVLDVMCWRGHPVFDCETDFRFYWLQTKVSETPEVLQKSRLNTYPFIPVPYHTSPLATITSILKEPCSSPVFGDDRVILDGLLFYHKNTHYMHGYTPLVGWLRPFMVPEVLGIPVAEMYMVQLPAPKKVTGKKEQKMDVQEEQTKDIEAS